MDKKILVKLGSNTAKNGFINEDYVVNKFNSWKDDSDAKKWLSIMGYDITKIESLNAVKLHGYKTDVQVKIEIVFADAIAAENISVKLVSNPKGFNQVDKRWIKTYIELWSLPPFIIDILRKFTGEDIISNDGSYILRDARRVFLDELYFPDQKILVDFFARNKFLIVSDILRGRGLFSANWMLVIQKLHGQEKSVLKNMSEVINHFASGEVVITNKGSLRIGKVTMQRKGGDAGRDTAKMLQFKINPAELFDI